MDAKVERFDALEGLRGWLAWAVLASHIVQAADLEMVSGASAFVMDFGERAVDVFIILSGFVVTHLITMRGEPYLVYLKRRAFRLAPAFMVACVVGAVAIALAAPVLHPDAERSAWARQVGALADAQAAHPLLHALLHMTMLHGLVPNTILPMSEYAFAPPGWSLSIEWQFYLIAPGVVWLWRRNLGPLIVLASAAAMYAAYRWAIAAAPGLWMNPSILPGVAPLFAIGIASRMIAHRFAGRIARPALLSFAALAIGFATGFSALGVWVAALAVIWARRDGARGLDRAFLDFAAAALSSRAAMYFGARSYAVYVIHVPLIMLAAVAYGGLIDVEPHRKALLLSVLAIPATLLAAHLIHAWIERPMIALGARRNGAVRAAAAH